MIRGAIAAIAVLLALTCGAQAQSGNSGCGISGGGVSGAINSVVVLSRTITTSPVAIASTDACKLLLLSSGASVLTLSVATAPGFGSGKYFWIDNQSGGSVTMNVTTSTLDGSSSVTIANNSTIGFQSDGANYHYFSLGGSGGGGGGCTTANPTATAGPAAVNGSASTCMRSDAAPAIQLGSNAQLGLAEADAVTLSATAGVFSVIGIPNGLVSISASCGNATGTGGIAIGTITSVVIENHQTGSNYPIAPSDCGKTIYLDSSSSQTPTIPVSGSTGFLTGWYTQVCNINTGVQTLTPASGTIGGASTLVLAAGTRAAPTCKKFFAESSLGTTDYGLY